MKFVNRVTERKFMQEIASDILNKKEMCVWIEGSRGAGKSYFLEYVKENSDMPIFTFGNHNWLFKCNESSIDNDYQLFVEIISAFQINYPKELNKFLVKYFENICDVSWVEALAYIIPDIKFTEWAKDLIHNSLDQIEISKSQITNMLYDAGIKKCLAMIVLHFWLKVEKRENIVLCIDDACWLDKNSIATFQILLNIIKYEKTEKLKLSLIILTRPINELDPQKQNYQLLENVLNNVYKEVKYIRIKNFNYQATQEYIRLMDKKYVYETVYNIYKVTEGNPQELFQALKFNDYEFKEIAATTDAKNDNYISTEIMMKLMNDNLYTLPVLCSIALVQQDMQLIWLITIIKNFCNQILHESFDSTKFDECIEILKTQSIVCVDTHIIQIVHDSWKELAIEYIKNNGEYISYIECIIDSIKNELPKNDAFIKEYMRLYNEFNPKECFYTFVKNYNKSTVFLDGSIIKFVAQSLSLEAVLYTKKNIEDYIVPIILERCIQLAYYELGYQICLNISMSKNDLSFEVLYEYLIYFAKILIDKGNLQGDEKYNAINIVEQVVNLPQLNPNQKIESYLVAMSAYEHVLDFANINKYNSLAEDIINNHDVNIIYRAMYLRNQGLVASHRNLYQQYCKAIYYSKKLSNKYEKNIMLGTCYNNLGLHYLYNSNIKEALQCFDESKKYLEEIGYDTFRVLNNIGICYMLNGQNSIAYNYLLQAKVLNTDCIFEKLCIQSNIAILEHKQGNHKLACSIIKPILDESKKLNKQTTDDLVYSSAMVNYAYFCFDIAEYWDALKWYKESLFFDYRYNDDLQKKKRNEMIKICMAHCGLSENMPHTIIDIEDANTDIFKKMYAPIPFAYYII